MRRFRERHIVIEAVQWYPGVRVEGVVESPVLEPSEDNPTGAYAQVHTAEGVMIAMPGDWIVRGIKGEVYPIKDDIFRMTYEPAE